MNRRLLMLGILLCAVGCAAKNNSDDGGTGQEMGVADMKKSVDLTCMGDKTVGDTCTSKCQCSGPHPMCATELDFPQNTFQLPDTYCTNANCDLTDSIDTCGDNGVCTDLIGDGSNNLCFNRCTRGKCRTGYSCLNVAPNPAKSTIASLCLPHDLFVECDPTMDPTTQCTMFQGQKVSGLTNGNPNAACLRIGPDDVGQCRFLPCQTGPGNCPMDAQGNRQSCFYFDVQTNTQNPNANDKFKGEVCLFIPAAGTAAKLGQTCTGGFNTCEDNLRCFNGTCVQDCYNGTPPSFMGGQTKFKNPATACPMGTKCMDAFTLGAKFGPGLCM